MLHWASILEKPEEPMVLDCFQKKALNPMALGGVPASVPLGGYDGETSIFSRRCGEESRELI